MTNQLLNENDVRARNLKNTNIRNVICLTLVNSSSITLLIMFIFDISFNIGRYKIVPPARCSATLYPESPLIVWFTLNRIFPHSSTPSTVLAFCAGVTRIYSGKVFVLEVQ